MSCRLILSLTLLLTLQLGACKDKDGEQRSLLQDAFAKDFPPSLAASTLFIGNDPARPNPELLTYDPRLPLWSDGASKSRFLYLPPGTQIESDEDLSQFKFPIGTLFIKHFTDPQSTLPVETRIMIRRLDAGWSFATYTWAADGTSTRSTRPHEEVVGGLRYRIPSEKECEQCHSRGEEVLGFTAWQLLSGGLLNTLARGNRILPEAAVRAASQEVGVSKAEVKEDRVAFALRYLDVNCGSCHQPQGPSKARDFDLRWGQQTRAGLIASGKMVEGSLENSAIWKRFIAESERMPQLSLRQDPQGLELIKDLIQGEDTSQD